MKSTLFMTAIVLTATMAIAGEPLVGGGGGGPRFEPGPVQEVKEGHDVVRAFIQNPDLGKQLSDLGLTEVGKITVQRINPAVTHYVLRLQSCGNCLPASGTVSISEDMQPTFADGPIKYDITVSKDK